MNVGQLRNLGKINELADTVIEGARYHVDDLDLSETGRFGEHVNPYDLPPKEVADNLVQSYFATIHRLFPVVTESVFLQQYEQFWENMKPPQADIAWLSMLNTIFAMGAVYAHYLQAPWKGSSGDHITYFMRARTLNSEPLGMISVPKLEHVQATALSLQYLLATFQVNR